MNVIKESDVNLKRSNNPAKRDGLKSNYKDHIMFMLGNKLLKDKVVVLRDQSQNAQAKNSLLSDFLLAVESNNFLLHVMLQTKVFPQAEGRNLKKVKISHYLHT